MAGTNSEVVSTVSVRPCSRMRSSCPSTAEGVLFVRPLAPVIASGSLTWPAPPGEGKRSNRDARALTAPISV